MGSHSANVPMRDLVVTLPAALIAAVEDAAASEGYLPQMAVEEALLYWLGIMATGNAGLHALSWLPYKTK